MKHSPTLLAILVATMATVAVPSASANILLNSGFEIGTDVDADNWNEIAGPAGSTTRSDMSPNCGEYHAYMEFDHIRNDPAGAAYFIEQNLGANTIDNTLDYNLSLFAKTDTTDFTGVDMFYQLLWLDQDGSDGGGVKGEILTSLVGLGIDTTYQQFGLDDIDVPDGADSFLLRFQLSAGAVDDIKNGLYVDDAVLEVVPEPASLGLLAVGLGLGGLLTLARRRRA